jgi:murein DD-endopeptidase MepM/ murein hydrolase activator NlpD
MKRSSAFAAIALVVGFSTPALAELRVKVTPAVVRPGDPVLVTVTGATRAPTGEADGAPLQFFAAKRGYQAVFAIPLDATPDTIAVEIDRAPRTAKVRIVDVTFPEADITVDEELAFPDARARERIDADNKAIVGATAGAKGAPRFVLPFRRPPGRVTSRFGEWRTFNEGHRSQHLGFDIAAREGSRIQAINAGTVVLVRDGFLTGKLVVVAHGGGIASAYFHLSKIAVDEGEVVARGAELGRVGQTGRTTGPHLHVGVSVPGGWVDPATFFKLRLAPKRAARR